MGDDINEDFLRLRVPKSLKAEVEAFAKSNERSVAYVVRKALEQYLARADSPAPSSISEEKKERILQTVRKARSRPSSPASKLSPPHPE